MNLDLILSVMLLNKNVILYKICCFCKKIKVVSKFICIHLLIVFECVRMAAEYVAVDNTTKCLKLLKCFSFCCKKKR